MSGVEQTAETDVPLGDCEAPEATIEIVQGKRILTSFS
jgi:hypothetical protein